MNILTPGRLLITLLAIGQPLDNLALAHGIPAKEEQFASLLEELSARIY